MHPTLLQYGNLPNTVMPGLTPARSSSPRYPYLDMAHQTMMTVPEYSYCLMKNQAPPMAYISSHGNYFSNYTSLMELPAQSRQNLEQGQFQPYRQQPRPAWSIASSDTNSSPPSSPKSQSQRKLRLEDPRTGRPVALPERNNSRFSASFPLYQNFYLQLLTQDSASLQMGLSTMHACYFIHLAPCSLAINVGFLVNICLRSITEHS